MRTATAALVVGIGGAAGSAARAGVSAAQPAHPLAATLAVNVLGAFALGLATGILAGGGPGGTAQGEGPGSRRRRGLLLLVGTGFCGGFTTYSAVAVQSADALRTGHPGVALAYVLVTLVVGVLAALAGLVAGERVRGDGWGVDSGRRAAGADA